MDTEAQKTDEQNNAQKPIEHIVDDMIGQVLIKIKQPGAHPEDVERVETLQADKKYVATRLGEILKDLELVSDKEIAQALNDQEKISKSKKK